MKTQKTKIWKKTKISKSFLVLLSLIGAAILMLAPIYHLKLPKYNPVVQSYEKKLDSKIDKIDEQIQDIKDRHDAGELESSLAYNEIFNVLYPLRKEQVDLNKKLLKDKVDEERIFGWKTWRSFANGWGQRLPYVVFVLAFSLMFFAFKFKDKWLFWSLVIFQLAGYTITIYQQVYSFWPGQDLKLSHYRGIIFTAAFFLSCGIMLFMKYYLSQTGVYKRIIRILHGTLIEDVPNYVRNEEEYEENVMWPTLKRVSDEIK